jgi:hypothetical protein
MGLFDFLGGGSTAKQNSSGNSKSIDAQVAGINKAGATSSQTGGVASSQETSGRTFELMDAATRANLAGVVANLSGNITGETGDTTYLRDRARGGDAALAGEIDKIMQAERLRGETALNSNLNVLAQGLGSRTNSGFASLAGQNISDLSTKLAGAEGQLRIGARQTVTDELQNVVSLINNNKQTTLAGITGVSGVLKGAAGTEVSSTSTRGEQLSTTNSINQDITAALTMGVNAQDYTSSGTSKTKNSPGILDFVKLLAPMGG